MNNRYTYRIPKIYIIKAFREFKCLIANTEPVLNKKYTFEILNLNFECNRQSCLKRSSNPVYTRYYVKRVHDIAFGQLAVIFTLTTFFMKSFKAILLQI